MDINIEDKDFSEITIQEIEEKLAKDIEKDNKRNKIKTIIIVLILIFIFHGTINFWLKFGIAIPKKYTLEKIDTSKDPIQIDYSPSEQIEKTFTYHSLLKEKTVTLIPQAHYVISGKVVATNHSFVIKSTFEYVALHDLGIVWGKLTDRKILKYMKFYSQKTELTGARGLHFSLRDNIPFSMKYIDSHFSHTHIIPANRNVMAAILKLRKYQNVKLEGELVDIENYVYTSLSREDTNETARGGGACEIMYVNKVQIGHKIYE